MNGLLPAHRRELQLAVEQLERQHLVARLAQATGTPVDMAMKYLPNAVNRRLREAIRRAMLGCLDVAVNSLAVDDGLGPTPDWFGKLLTGVSGGIGGFFGMPALPFELPLTTAFMLRSIAEIARDEGEDLRQLDARLACLEVFALGGGRGERNQLHLQYFVVRSALTRLTRDIGRYMLERGAINASSPLLARFLGEIVSRFGFAVSDRFASALVPVVGALGGAAVNVIFTDHFQRVGRAHFIVRRLERDYGEAVVRQHYEAALTAANPSCRPRRDVAN
jgi:EcsC protein family